ncbi:MAG: sialate O-acetylesterase [Kiritimatiellia bacterium]|jgi:hypothetical protein
MKMTKKTAGIILIGISAFALALVVKADVPMPSKEKFKIVVLAGQSNMAGRGTRDAESAKPHPRVLMMNRAGEWVPCVDPIHFDIANSGVGPGKTFAEALAESDPTITVGVVPCAVGGSPISVWEPGKSFYKGKTDWHPYDDCLERTKKAMEQGTLAAILWHQGESDCSRKGGYLYQVRFPLLVLRLRKEFDAEGVPLIVGGLAQKKVSGFFGKIISNCQTLTCEYLYGPGRFVPARADYSLQPDGIHFSTKSQRDFGKRYFEAFVNVKKAMAEDPQYWKKLTPPATLAPKGSVPYFVLAVGCRICYSALKRLKKRPIRTKEVHHENAKSSCTRRGNLPRHQPNLRPAISARCRGEASA